MKTKCHTCLFICELLFGIVVFSLCINPNVAKRTDGSANGGGYENGNNGRDRGIGYKKIHPNAPTTPSPYPFKLKEHPKFRYHIGKKMEKLQKDFPGGDMENEPDYYDEYDFEFAKSGINSPSFLTFYKEKQNKIINYRKNT